MSGTYTCGRTSFFAGYLTPLQTRRLCTTLMPHTCGAVQQTQYPTRDHENLDAQAIGVASHIKLALLPSSCIEK